MPRDPRPGILSIQQLRPSSNTLWGEMRSSGFDQPEESRRQRSIVQESAVARLAVPTPMQACKRKFGSGWKELSAEQRREALKAAADARPSRSSPAPAPVIADDASDGTVHDEATAHAEDELETDRAVLAEARRREMAALAAESSKLTKSIEGMRHGSLFMQSHMRLMKGSEEENARLRRALANTVTELAGAYDVAEITAALAQREDLLQEDLQFAVAELAARTDDQQTQSEEEQEEQDSEAQNSALMPKEELWYLCIKRCLVREGFGLDTPEVGMVEAKTEVLCLERHKVEGVDRIRCEHGWLSVRGKSGRVFLRPMLAGVVARTKSAGVVARTKSAAPAVAQTAG